MHRASQPKNGAAKGATFPCAGAIGSKQPNAQTSFASPPPQPPTIHTVQQMAKVNRALAAQAVMPGQSSLESGQMMPPNAAAGSVSRLGTVRVRKSVTTASMATAVAMAPGRAGGIGANTHISYILME